MTEKNTVWMASGEAKPVTARAGANLDKEWVNRVDLVVNESSGTEWLALKHQRIDR